MGCRVNEGVKATVTVGIALALLATAQLDASFADTYQLTNDFGIVGTYHRCKYSNRKVYGFPKDAACKKSITPTMESGGSIGSQTSDENVDSDPDGLSAAEAPSIGVWWHAISSKECINGLSPAAAWAQLEESGSQFEMQKDGETIIFLVTSPQEARYLFFPTRKKCEEFLGIVPQQPPRAAPLLPCGFQELSDAQSMRGAASGSYALCTRHQDCNDCATALYEVQASVKWDQLHRRCGVALPGVRLMIAIIVQTLKNGRCSY